MCCRRSKIVGFSSVRIPSAFNGLYGLRPSYGRIPYGGAANSMEGQESILSVFGPLSNSLSGIEIFMKAVIAAKPWLKDPIALRKAWDDDGYALVDHGRGKKLCFGILWDDGQTIPHPPISRALEIVKAALTKAGHIGSLIDPILIDKLTSDLLQSWIGYHTSTQSSAQHW